MKKAICFLLLMMFAIPCFAEATYKILKTQQKNDVLMVEVKYLDTGINETVNIPIFHPDSKTYVDTSIRNRYYTIKSKYDASEKIKTIKPDVDHDINKTILINKK